MSDTLTAAALYEVLQPKLKFIWASGQAGRRRIIRYQADDTHRDVSLIGHLNFIHPHRIQVLGAHEIAYLHSLSEAGRKEAINQLFGDYSDLIILGENQSLPDDIRQRADAASLPILTSPLSTQELIAQVQYYYASLYAERTSEHGVFMEVMGIGVLITGDACMGKSELALELVSRGHRLIADDVPEFSRIAPDTLAGSCPELLRDFLEVRGLGVLNIRALFGDSAIKQSKYLRLIIHLEPMSDQQIRAIDRLHGSRRTRTILGIEVPQVTLPVAPGRNLAVLVEAAARSHILFLKGYDASQVFIDRQQKQIQQNTP